MTIKARTEPPASISTVTLTPGLHPASGIYERPGFYQHGSKLSIFCLLCGRCPLRQRMEETFWKSLFLANVISGENNVSLTHLLA